LSSIALGTLLFCHLLSFQNVDLSTVLVCQLPSLLQLFSQQSHGVLNLSELSRLAAGLFVHALEMHSLLLEVRKHKDVVAIRPRLLVKGKVHSLSSSFRHGYLA
jgi:hypothetical protein